MNNVLRILMVSLFFASVAFVPMVFAGESASKGAGKSDISAGSADKKSDEKAKDAKKGDMKKGAN